MYLFVSLILPFLLTSFLLLSFFLSVFLYSFQSFFFLSSILSFCLSLFLPFFLSSFLPSHPPPLSSTVPVQLLADILSAEQLSADCSVSLIATLSGAKNVRIS